MRNFVKSVQKSIHTSDGMIRIRWWPLVISLHLAIAYVAANVVTLAMVGAGAKMHLNAFVHAPLIWIAGL